MTAAALAQSTDTVLMVRPAVFYPNAETAPTNAFQCATPSTSSSDLLRLVQAEFDAAVRSLAAAGVRTVVIPARPDEDTPDALYPNNWLSTHADGTLVLYPMLAPNRRRERRPELVAALSAEYGFAVAKRIDLSPLEATGEYVEGTGSLVFDHAARRAYVCRSPRATPGGIAAAARALELDAHCFAAVDERGGAIYHTNVLLALGTRFAVVCLGSLPAPHERVRLRAALEEGGREILAISLAQMQEFAANVLELRTAAGAPLLALSTRALAALRPAERRMLERHATLVPVTVPTIETVGGGGIRCMLAEIFLPRALVPGHRSLGADPVRSG
jgi:hypothetical protein